ncbi:MAG: hypothetical protein OEV88_17990, partial [Gammaproteobacteria bacterium]|nr:hypothetical protein [Gammaproteobacteria bacterium]
MASRLVALVSFTLALPFLAGASATRAANCSTSLFGGDPTGILTNAIAFKTVNSNPPAALFVLSDVSQKGFAVGTGPGAAFASSTPFADYMLMANGTLAIGLSAGNDVFLLADRQQAKPGQNEVDVMEGGTERNGGERKSLYILGDASKPYYAGKGRLSDTDRDYAYINRFVPGQAQIRLNGRPSDYRLTWISGLFSQSIAGTAIVTQKTCDVVGFVRGALLTNTAGRDFQYAVAPAPTPAVDSAWQQGVRGIDQIGSAGDPNIAGRVTPSAADKDGNVYMAFGSAAASVNGVGGVGSFYLVKYDASGRRLWTRKHGTNAGDGITAGLQTPQAVVARGGYLYVAGMTFGPYGGPRPAKTFAGSDGVLPFIAKYDAADGSLVKVVQVKVTAATQISPVYTLAADNAGNLYLGGSYVDGIHLPLAIPFVTKVKGSSLAVDTSFGVNGSAVFRNGPVTVFDSLNLLAAAMDNLQITAFTSGIRFVPDGSGTPGSGDLYVAGTSDNGSFFGSLAGWNAIWYLKLDAGTGDMRWQGNYSCNLRLQCGYTGGYSLSAPNSDSVVFAIDVDADGNLYLGGETGASFSEVGHEESLLSPTGTQLGKGDGFVARIAPDGALQWLRHIGTDASDNIRDLIVDGDAVYVLGETRGSLAGYPAGG